MCQATNILRTYEEDRQGPSSCEVYVLLKVSEEMKKVHTPGSSFGTVIRDIKNI